MGGRGSLKVSIDFPNFKLNLESDSPTDTLHEVRRIIESFNEPVEDFELSELRSRLSEEFFQHHDLLARVRNSLVLDEEVRVGKQTLPVLREYDLEAGQETCQLQAARVKERVMMLFAEFPERVRECLVHIRGNIDKEQQRIIMDCVRQRLGLDGSVRFFLTKRNLEGNVLVEAVGFSEAE